MTRSLITAAMIVRDEEAYLGSCLVSLSGVVDEVVVVDTGSTDRSREIALDHRARLLSFPWREDFSAARNYALEHAQGDWILYIDADERITSSDRPSFREQLRDPRLAALTVRFRPSSGMTRYLEPRVFRNHPEIRFTGVFHETHLPDLWRHLKITGRQLGHAELDLDHLGYDGCQDHKHERNLPLLEARLSMTPEHLYSWVHLGSTYEARGDEEKARRAWSRGLDLVRARPEPEAQDCLPFLALLRFGIRRGDDTDELLDEALERFPDNLWLSWLQANRLIRMKRFELALEILTKIDAIDSKSFVDPTFAYEERLFSVWVHDALGLCHFRLDCPLEAARQFEIAEIAEPTLERKAKRLLACGRVNRGASTQQGLGILDSGTDSIGRGSHG